MGNFDKLISSGAEAEPQSLVKLRKIIDEFPASRFKGESRGDKRLLTSETGEQFEVDNVTYKNEKECVKFATELRKFLSGFFEEEENDSVEDYVTAIRESLGNFIIIRNKAGKLVSVMNTQFAGVEADADTRMSQSELIVWYVVTGKKYQGKGLASELYKAAYSATLERAIADKSDVVAIVGETDPTVEGYLNKMQRRRVYFEDSASGDYKELPYVAPPTESDEIPSPEHLMVRYIDDKKVASASDVLKLVRGIYDQYLRPEYFTYLPPGEAESYKQKVSEAYKDIEESLKTAVNGQVYLWSEDEREAKRLELKKSGKKIDELMIE